MSSAVRVAPSGAIDATIIGTIASTPSGTSALAPALICTTHRGQRSQWRTVLRMRGHLCTSRGSGRHLALHHRLDGVDAGAGDAAQVGERAHDAAKVVVEQADRERLGGLEQRRALRVGQHHLALGDRGDRAAHDGLEALLAARQQGV